MTENRSRRFSSYRFCLVLWILCSSSTGCWFNVQKTEYNRAKKAADIGEHQEALLHFEKVIRLDPKGQLALEAARQGARIAHLEANSYLQAIRLYRHLILHSPIEKERMEAQRRIAYIYFEKLSDYSESITEFSRLLRLPHTKNQDLDYRFAIAKSYFYLNNFYQSTIEIDNILRKVEKRAKRFEYLAFKGNVLLTTKKLEGAIKIFNQLIEEYPEESLKENIPISLAVTFEEKGDYKEAIKILEQIKKNHPAPDFLELRIKRLRERVMNQPGARGLVK